MNTPLNIQPNRKYLVAAVVFNLLFIAIYFFVPFSKFSDTWFEYVACIYLLLTFGYCFSLVSKGKSFFLVLLQLFTIEFLKLGGIGAVLYMRLGFGFVMICMGLLAFIFHMAYFSPPKNN